MQIPAPPSPDDNMEELQCVKALAQAWAESECAAKCARVEEEGSEMDV